MNRKFFAALAVGSVMGTLALVGCTQEDVDTAQKSMKDLSLSVDISEKNGLVSDSTHYALAIVRDQNNEVVDSFPLTILNDSAIVGDLGQLYLSDSFTVDVEVYNNDSTLLYRGEESIVDSGNGGVVYPDLYYVDSTTGVVITDSLFWDNDSMPNGGWVPTDSGSTITPNPDSLWSPIDTIPDGGTPNDSIVLDDPGFDTSWVPVDSFPNGGTPNDSSVIIDPGFDTTWVPVDSTPNGNGTLPDSMYYAL